MCEQGTKWWHTGESRVQCGLLSWALMCRLLLCQWGQRPEVSVCCRQISLTNPKPRGLEWKAPRHQWKLKLGKSQHWGCMSFFFFQLKTRGENSSEVQPSGASVCKGCFYAALLWLFQARCFWLQRGIGASLLRSSDSGLTGWSAVSLIHPRRRSGRLTMCSLMICSLCVKPRVSHSLISRRPRQRWHTSAEITQLAAGWKSYRHWQQGFSNEQTENILGSWAWCGASGTNTWQIRASCKMTFTLLFWGCIFQFWPIQTDYNLPPCGCCRFVPVDPFFFPLYRLLRPEAAFKNPPSIL